ncbi:MAG: DNA alkylation response protein, partial [Gemmobacter sp.]
MTDIAPRADLATHEVTNQPAPEARDLWASDPGFRHWAGVAGADGAALAEFGARAGAVEWQVAARAANRHVPELRLFDRGGRRLDEVAFHPAYHRLMELGLSAG